MSQVLPHLWDECDIMLIGPSRAGKTPLSFYLAQRGYKAAGINNCATPGVTTGITHHCKRIRWVN